MNATSRLVFVLVALVLLVALGIAVAGALREPEPTPARIANGWIAVSANPDNVGGGEAGDIYLVSGETRRIIGATDDGVAQACPQFSPDGARLAYAEARASGPVTTARGQWPVAERAVAVVALNQAGEVAHSIVRIPLPPEPGELACPKWSPDGRQIAFRVGAELWIADADSGERTILPVARVPWGQAGFAWSRDSSRIAVSESGAIEVVSVAGGTSTTFSAEGSTPASLAWTAGDASIIYMETDNPGDGRALHIVGADGMGDITLSPDPPDPQIQPRLVDAVIRPDGTRVAYIDQPVRCFGGGCRAEPIRILTVALDGSDLVEVRAPDGFLASGLLWSPDGEHLLVSSIDGLVSITIASGATAVLSSGDLNLEWSYSEVTWQADDRGDSED